MRFSFVSGVRNDLLQIIANNIIVPGTEGNLSRPSFFWNNVYGPAAVTAILTYTVPANRRARVSSCHVESNRATAATANGIVQTYIMAIDVASSMVRVCECLMSSNTVGARSHTSIAGPFWLNAGESLRMYYANSDTGGTVWHTFDAVITEYDV